MKAAILISLLVIYSFAGTAQIIPVEGVYYNKGTFLLNAAYINSGKVAIAEEFYSSNGIRFGGSFYKFNQFSVGADLGFQKLRNFSNTTTSAPLDNNNVYSVTALLHYDVFRNFHFGNVYVEGGANGWIVEGMRNTFMGWEAFGGVKVPLMRPHFWVDFAGGVRGDDGFEKITNISTKLGLSYAFTR